MKLMKNILIHILIVLIILMACFSVYYSSKHELPVYADSNTSEWTQVTTNEELAEAFRYYCKSRNLAIEGSVLDGLTTFTTNNFNTICNTLGINITALQANIKKSTDSNGGLQFLFDTSGITAYNRIFAEFLQNNDLSVGDTADEQNNTLYSGIYATVHGYTCLVYIVDNNGNTENYAPTILPNKIQFGSPFMYTRSELKSAILSGSDGGMDRKYKEINIYYSDSNYVTQTGRAFWENGKRNYAWTYYSTSYPNNAIEYYNSSNQLSYTGDIVIWKPVGTNTLYLGNCSYNVASDRYTFISWHNIESDNKSNVIIYLNTNNKTINNNTYTDNRQTVINNEGDVYNYNYDDNEPPVNPPPSTVTPPTNSGGSDGDVTFPNFNFQLPQIDWSLGDLHDKFPFSIPFDLVEFLTVLNAEPLTPEFEGDLNLGIINHHFEFDLHQFDNLAQLLRAMEFIGFCIGLIYITRQMIRV